MTEIDVTRMHTYHVCEHMNAHTCMHACINTQRQKKYIEREIPANRNMQIDKQTDKKESVMKMNKQRQRAESYTQTPEEIKKESSTQIRVRQATLTDINESVKQKNKEMNKQRQCATHTGDNK